MTDILKWRNEIKEMKRQKHFCGDCERFTPVNEVDGECSKHGYTDCMSFNYCKDFIEFTDYPTEKGGVE